MSDIITAVDPNWVSEFSGHILGTIPQEKIQCELRQVKCARIMQAAGSVQLAQGIGQRMTVMDPRLFFRLRQAYGPEEYWIDELLSDNPSLRAKGYIPRRSGTRHGITYIKGKPVGVGPHSEKGK